MEPHLKKRIQYFFNSPHRGRGEIRHILNDLQQQGDVAVVGGMLRDIALFGNLEFKSDVDLVINANDIDLFERSMISKGAKINRFGGYSLPSSKWQVDVWPLCKTWAHVAGHVEVKSFDDISDATFFGCDAIIYDINQKRIVTKNEYFQKLNQRILDINLEPNPNPIGNAVRAFRYSALKGFRWAPRLTEFIARTIEENGWTRLIEAEAISFRTRHIESINRQEFLSRLGANLSSSRKLLFDPRQHDAKGQLELPFDQ